MEKRSINFTVRLTKKEYDFIKQQADELDITMGAYVRMKAITRNLEERKGLEQ